MGEAHAKCKYIDKFMVPLPSCSSQTLIVFLWKKRLPQQKIGTFVQIAEQETFKKKKIKHTRDSFFRRNV
uniref:Uncharacterized protein n=1 Tax=Octopus bimaculoides TaxID=37653 RepID=A0A0L8I2R5_OCTBM